MRPENIISPGLPNPTLPPLAGEGARRAEGGGNSHGISIAPNIPHRETKPPYRPAWAKTTRRLPKRPLALTAMALLLAACGGVPDTYHSLRPDISTIPARQGTPTAIRYTELPPYYENEYLTYYDGAGRITLDKSHHWIYPFRDNLRDVLRQALAAATNNSRTYTYPLGENNRPDILIDLQIRELIADVQAGQYRISAQWQNTRRDSDTPENHEYRRLIPLTQTDPDSLVAATATAVRELAQAIAASLPH